MLKGYRAAPELKPGAGEGRERKLKGLVGETDSATPKGLVNVGVMMSFGVSRHRR